MNDQNQQQQAQQNQQQQDQPAGEEWACSRCTFINDAETTVCEMCDQVNPSMRLNAEVVRVDGQLVPVWQCSVCGYNHWSANVVAQCVMCDAPRLMPDSSLP